MYFDRDWTQQFNKTLQLDLEQMQPETQSHELILILIQSTRCSVQHSTLTKNKNQ